MRTDVYRCLDPRVKILHLGLMSAAIFFTRSVPAQVALGIAVAAVAYLSGHPRRALRFLAFVGTLAALVSAPLLASSGMLQFYVKFVLFFVLKFAPGVLLVVVLSQTEDVTRFIHALERLRFPRSLTLPFAVAMRFVPSLSYELGCIKDAMRLRGLRPTLAGFYRHPILTLEYLSVPLLMRSLKIADELSASALTRGIDAVGSRTRYSVLVFSRRDVAGALAGVLVAGLIVIFDRWFV